VDATDEGRLPADRPAALGQRERLGGRFAHELLQAQDELDLGVERLTVPDDTATGQHALDGPRQRHRTAVGKGFEPVEERHAGNLPTVDAEDTRRSRGGATLAG
jgi:hypothetical protein